MDVSHQALDVRVSKRILWFGSEAYPLPNITRTGTVTLEPDRRAAIRGFVTMTLVTLFVMSIVAGTTTGFVATLAVLAGLGWIGYRLYKLVEFLNLRLYELNVETAAASHRGVISDNPKVVTDLQDLITDAIDNPQAEFQVTVDNFQIGDNFTMLGHNTVNKAAR
jgi:uncharacterized protein DUF6232